ncbi:MAG: hypothetical protein K2P87_07800 [Lachnospiraceae bacterium]|nr:hypothetical protein [Lachnospiraceae bacterium]
MNHHVVDGAVYNILAHREGWRLAVCLKNVPAAADSRNGSSTSISG